MSSLKIPQNTGKKSSSSPVNLLRESEKRFRDFVTNSAYGYAELDPAGNITYANPLAEKITGYSLKRHRGLSITKLLVKEDLNRAMQDFARVFTEPNDGPREYRIRTRTGAIRHIEINSVPLVRDGGVQGMQTTLRDITSRKLTEQQRDAHEFRLKTVNHTAIELAAAASLPSMYGILCRRLTQITGGLVAGIARFDEPTRSLVLCRIHARPSVRRILDTILPGPLKNTAMPLDNMRSLGADCSRHVVELRGYRDLFCGVITPKTERELKRRIPPGRMFGLTLAHGKDIIGVMSLVLPPDTTFDDFDILDNFASLAAVSILRKSNEARVKALNTGLEKRVAERTRDLKRELKQHRTTGGQLKKAMVLNETVLKTIPFGMNIVDHNGTILYANDYFRHRFGKKIIGGKCYRMFRDNHKKCPDCPLQEAITSGRTSTIETAGILGGRTYRISHTGMVYNGKKAVLEIFEDVTPRVWAESELARMTEDLFIINTIHGHMNEGRSLPEIMSSFNREVRRTFNCHGAVLYLYHPHTDELVMQNFLLPGDETDSLLHSRGIDMPDKIRVSLRNSPGFRAACRSKAPKIITAAAEIRRNLTEGLTLPDIPASLRRAIISSVQKKTPFRSLLNLPLWSRDKLMGLMVMVGPQPFTPQVLQRMNTIAADIASALERKIFEDSIRESENKYKELSELLPQTVYEMDADGTISFVNSTGLSIFGYSEKDLDRGISVFEAIDPSEHEAVRRNMREIMEENRTGSSEYTALKKDGTPFPVLNYSAPVIRNGRPEGLRGIILDISERKKIERTLRESEERYRNVVERANDGITILQDEKIVYANPALSAMSGSSADQLKGTPFISFIHPDERQTIAERYNRRLRGEPIPSIYESVLQHRDGHAIHVELNAGIITFLGRPAHLVFVRDITERKRTDRQLQESLHEKDLLLNEIHHRVKNNLQVITSLLNLQSQYIADQATRDIFADCKSRVRSMALIHEKLYRSADIARVDFADYLQTLLSNLFRTYGSVAGGIRLQLDVSGIFLDIDTAVPCGLIINELVSNALKYAFKDAKGTIRLTMPLHTGTEYQLTVADDGAGFPDGIDFRHTASLGLQLVCTLVDQLNGTIHLDRTHGSIFSIRFPVSRRKNE